MKKALFLVILLACAGHVNRSQVYVQNVAPDAEILGHDSVLVFEGTVMTVCLPDAKTKRIACYPLGDLNPPPKQQAQTQTQSQPKPEEPKSAPELHTSEGRAEVRELPKKK